METQTVEPLKTLTNISWKGDAGFVDMLEYI